MEQTYEHFTLETIAEFYTAAAKAGGMEVLRRHKWSEALIGPNLSSSVSDWRPKQVPVVKYVIKFPDGACSSISFKFESAAVAWAATYVPSANGQVIKLTEEL